MKKVLQSTQSWELENVSLSMDEYYDFMMLNDEQEEVDKPDESVNTKVTLKDIKIDVNPWLAHWLAPTLHVLNNKLSPLKAKCSVNEDTAKGSPAVLISAPQDDADNVVNWEGEVRKEIEEYLSCYVEKECKFPGSLELDIVKKISQGNDFNFKWKANDNGILLYGHKDKVNEVYTDLHHFVEEVQVDVEEKHFPKRHITFLSLRCRRQLNVNQVERYDLNMDEEKISVQGTKLGRESFWKMLESEINHLIEKKVFLKPELYDLLKSPEGIEKIHELMGPLIATVVYCLENDDDNNCYLYFVSSSSNVGESKLKGLKERFKGYFCYSEVPVDQSKHRFCCDMKWNKLVCELERQSFVSIVFDQQKSLINISGEKLAVGNIQEKLESHLRDVSNVEEHFKIDYSKWKIMFTDLKHKVDAIENDFGKNIRIISPHKVDHVQGKQVVITIQGDPSVVDNVKVRLQHVESEVCYVKEKISGIPAAQRLVSRLNPQIALMTHEQDASIEVEFIDEDIQFQSKASTSKSHPTKICSATLPSDVHVSLYSDNFTKHRNIQTIINFVRETPDDTDMNLKLLFETAKGKILRNELHTTTNTVVQLSWGTLVRMNAVDGLDCNELYHAIIPCWSGGSNNEEYYLQKCLYAILDEIRPSGTLLLTSICSNPLLYPAKIFARKVVTCFSSHLYNPFDLIVAIYVSDASDAKEFQDLFENPKMRCRSMSIMSQPQAKDGGKIISHSIDTFISLVKGNILDHQVRNNLK